jgi:hypothetical protein
MTKIQDALQQVVSLLRAHGFDQEAADFPLQIEKLASPDPTERAAAAQAIEHRSSPRWLGDLYLQEVTLQDWWGLLECAAECAERAAKCPTL